MAEVIPRHVLCVLGKWRDLDEVEATVRRVGGSGFELDREFSRLAPDARMPNSFQASYDRVTPSVTEEDRRRFGSTPPLLTCCRPPCGKIRRRRFPAEPCC
jgi:hypothetical protein